MQLINILILWLTLGLILISINQGKNQSKDVKQDKVKVRKNIFSFIAKAKQTKVKDESQNNEQAEKSTASSEMLTQTSNPETTSNSETNTIPEIKKADVFVADFSNKNQDSENNQNSISQESVVEPIEEAVEQIENGEDGEGILTTAEVEEDEPIINIKVENVFDKFFPKENTNQTPAYTVESDFEGTEGEYNSFSTSEEPWYEHPSVRKLINNCNNIFEKEPRKFEIVEKSY